MMCQSTSDGINLNVLHFPFLWLFNHHLVGFANHLGKNLHHMPGTSKEGLNLLFKLFLQIWDTADAVHTYTDLWTMLIHVGGKICPLGAEEHLEIFQNKHLNSNWNDASAAADTWCADTPLSLQAAITGGECSIWDISAFRSVIRKLKIIHTFSSSILQVIWIKRKLYLKSFLSCVSAFNV